MYTAVTIAITNKDIFTFLSIYATAMLDVLKQHKASGVDTVIYNDIQIVKLKQIHSQSH